MTFALRPVLWCGPVDRCDLCQRPAADEPGFGDVPVFGAAGAWGSGQQYGRLPGGRWVVLRGGRL